MEELIAVLRPIVEFAEEIRKLRELLEEVYSPVPPVYDSGTGRVVATIDLRKVKGRIVVEVWVRSEGADTFYVEGSRDGREENFRTLATLSTTATQREAHDGFWNAYPVVRCWADSPNFKEIEVLAAR